jgi:membrane fusion protein (multidrug efflux system)
MQTQVESFINPINTRVSAYIKEIRFVEHQPVKGRYFTNIR